MAAAAAIVRFLQAQYVRRDGVEHRLINGVFGIFGHGNVTGLGQALEEHGGRTLPFYQPKNEQAMVHMAVAFAKTKPASRHIRLHLVGRPRRHQSHHGRRDRHGQPPARAAAARRHLREPPARARAAATGISRQPGRERERLLPTRLEILGPSQPSRATAHRVARGDARARRSGRDRGGDALPARGCAGRELRLSAKIFSKNASTISSAPRRSAEAARRRRAAPARARRPLIVAGGGVRYSDACAALRSFAEATGIPVAVTQAGKGAMLDAHPSCLGAIGVTGTAAANALALNADLVICVGTRLADFTTASKTQFQNPRVRFIGINVNAADAHKHGAQPLVGDARTIIAQLTRALAGWRARGPPPRRGVRPPRVGKTVARDDFAGAAQRGRAAHAERRSSRVLNECTAARRARWCTRRAAFPATSTSSGAASPRPITIRNTATPAWATKSPARSA